MDTEKPNSFVPPENMPAENAPLPQDEPVQNAAQQPMNDPTPPQGAPAKKKSRKKLFIILGAAAALLLLIIIIAAAAGGDDTSNESSSNSTTRPSSSSTTTRPSSDTAAEDSGRVSDTTDLSRLAAFNGSDAAIRALPAEGKTYTHTVMIYLVGTDLESGDPDMQYNGGAASRDIQEILDAGADTENNHIIIMTGGTADWKMEEIPSDRTMMFEVDGSSLKTIYEAEDNLNMADPSTLYSLVKYCFEKYETDCYDLILWDHGGGPINGYGIDEISGDVMILPEIAVALEKSCEETGKKLEIVGFDACLMGSLEVANALKDTAEYMIASEEVESGFGWDYSFLSELGSPDMDGARLSQKIIDGFIENTPYGYAATLTCIDLGALPAFLEKTDAYFASDSMKLSGDGYYKVSGARAAAAEFGKDRSEDQCYDLVDLMSFVLHGDNSAQADALLAAYGDMLVYTRSNLSAPVGGLSVYFPFTNRSFADSVMEYYPNFSFSSAYADYVKSFHSARQSGYGKGNGFDLSSVPVEITPETSGNRTVSLTLTDAQVKEFDRASLYIWHKGAEEDYDEDDVYEIMFRTDITYLNGNVLSGSFQNKTVYAADADGESDRPVYFVEQEALSGGTQILFGDVLLMYFSGIKDDLTFDFKSGIARLQVAKDESETEFKIVNAILSRDNGKEVSLSERRQVDIHDFETISFTFRSRAAAYSADGKLLPLTQGENTSWTRGFEFDVNNDFRLFQKEIPEDELNEYVAQFVITDVNGNQSGSALIPLG